MDAESPIIIVGDEIVVNNDAGICGAAVDLPIPVVTDNCEVKTISNNAPDVFAVGSTTVTWTATDIHENTSTAEQLVTVTNEFPEIQEIQATLDPVPINIEITVTAVIMDSNLESLTWEWGDGSSSYGSPDLMMSTMHQYNSTGVYTITLAAVDACGWEDIFTFQYIVVFDPDGGFVTGGGWFNSPAGASTYDPEVVGKAKFGFVSKYKKGSTVPDGNTEFQFKAGDLNFNSYVYDWLVIAGSKAMFKGEGTINGAGEYGFIISAVDGDLKPNGAEDLFRIKIWEKANDLEVIYDNELGDEEDAEPTTGIGGGSIVIHTKPAKKSALVIDPKDKVNIYPNPFDKSIYIDLIFQQTNQIIIDLVDMNGRVVEYLYTGVIEASIIHQFEFIANSDLKPGFYMLRIRNVDGEYLGRKMIMKR